MTPGPHPGLLKQSLGVGWPQQLHFSPAQEALTFRVRTSSGSEPAREGSSEAGLFCLLRGRTGVLMGDREAVGGGEHSSGSTPAPLSLSVKRESQSGCDERTCALYEYLCDGFPTDVPGDRELTGPGQGALGKVGQDAELIFPPLPQGHLGLIHGWSRVRLAQAPPGPGSREEPRIASFCVRSESSGRPGAEPDAGSPDSARSGCRRPRGPPAAVWLPEALMLLPSPPLYHVVVLPPATGVGSPDGVAHV